MIEKRRTRGAIEHVVMNFKWSGRSAVERSTSADHPQMPPNESISSSFGNGVDGIMLKERSVHWEIYFANKSAILSAIKGSTAENRKIEKS
jgi:hypothetical protein